MSVAAQYSLMVDLPEYLKEQAIDMLPALHISAHGSENGIQLTSGEVVDWVELRDLVMPINKLFNGNLLLCISSCSLTANTNNIFGFSDLSVVEQ